MKGEWVLGERMKGLMFWDYDGDDNQGTLAKSRMEVCNEEQKKS